MDLVLPAVGIMLVRHLKPLSLYISYL